MRSGEYYSKGKFLLSGEYFVLHGAKALAVPLKFGQKMIASNQDEPGRVNWETYVLGNLYFSAIFNKPGWELIKFSDQRTALFIQNIFKEAEKLRKDHQQSDQGFLIRNYVDFDLKWGLGSSSSLLSNFAYLYDADPYELYRKIFQGSGFDIFCSRAERPILYQLVQNQPVVRETSFNPTFAGQLYFVYSGHKQDSQASVDNFKAKKLRDDQITGEISGLTEDMLNSLSLADFMKVMRAHEEILSAELGLPRVKQEFFADFNGEIKSLGAWGGDFVMVATEMEYKEVKKYFAGKKLEVVFKWDEMVY